MANWMSLPPGKYAIEIGGKKQFLAEVTPDNKQ